MAGLKKQTKTKKPMRKLFTQSDLREAFYQGMDHHNIPYKYFGFDEWLAKYEDGTDEYFTKQEMLEFASYASDRTFGTTEDFLKEFIKKKENQ